MRYREFICFNGFIVIIENVYIDDPFTPFLMALSSHLILRIEAALQELFRRMNGVYPKDHVVEPRLIFVAPGSGLEQ